MEESSRVIDAEQMEKAVKSWKATALKWWMMMPLICPLWPIWARGGMDDFEDTVTSDGITIDDPLRFT